MLNRYYELKVIREGLFTTIQDSGFKKLQHLGLSVSGAMDDYLYILGNYILFNKPNTPSIEFSQFGPRLLVKNGTINITITGDVNFNLIINKIKLKGLPNKSYFLQKNDEIDILNTINTNYGYLSIKNGIKTSSFKESSSTLIYSNIGGNNGKKIYNNQYINGLS